MMVKPLPHANDGTVRPPKLTSLAMQRRTCRDDDLDLRRDPAELTAALVDIPSVSGTEGPIADAVEAALRATARGSRWCGSGTRCWPAPSSAGRPGCCWPGTSTPCRSPDNVPSRTDGDLLHGCGTTDMKSGDAMLLHLAATLPEPSRDLTFVFYDCEEIEHDRNGLTRIETGLPEWLAADLAILGEPTNGQVEAGCQGTVSVAGDHPRPRAHFGAILVGGQRHPRRGAGAGAARGLPSRGSSTSTAATYREGLNAVRHLRRGRGQRHSRRVRDASQLPVRARSHARRRRRRCSRSCLRRVRRDGARRRRRCPARA